MKPAWPKGADGENVDYTTGVQTTYIVVYYRRELTESCAACDVGAKTVE